MKNTISEVKNILEGINSRLDETEARINDLEDKVEKYPIKATKRKKEFFKKRIVKGLVEQHEV